MKNLLNISGKKMYAYMMYLPDTTFNLFRCHTKVSEGCVVSCGQRSIVSKFHVENISSNNGFGGRKKAW
ncbi:MAG: hypothetical protein MJY74_05130 [Bacteroidaceae bacterium]|nr:hypothetical protein [Bacteroidaceae bacterium]